MSAFSDIRDGRPAMRLAIAATCILLCPAAAPCQVAPNCQEEELNRALANCAAYPDAGDRLACFDSLARGAAQKSAKPPAAEATPAEPPTRPWELVAMKDPIDDTTTVSMGSFGQQHQSQVVVRCRQRKLEVLLSWQRRFIGATDPVVWTRFGTAKAEKKRWSLSADHKAAFLAGDAKPFVQQMLTAERLVVQTDHFAQGRITEVFDLRGIKDVIGPLKEECRIE